MSSKETGPQPKRKGWGCGNHAEKLHDLSVYAPDHASMKIKLADDLIQRIDQHLSETYEGS